MEDKEGDREYFVSKLTFENEFSVVASSHAFRDLPFIE